MIDHRKIEDAIDSYFKNTPTAKIIENLDRLSADREKDLERENINHKTTHNNDPVIGNLVRFEEVSPANQDVAFLAVSIEQLAAPLGLPLYEGYDDLDEMWLTFLTLPSGETVTLMEYLHSPQPGVCISVDANIQNIPQVVFDSCLQLQVSREEISWFHPDWQEEIDRLYIEHGAIEKRVELSPLKELPRQNQYEPIDCFNHALRIYTREYVPATYWAMLQRNLGLAYVNRIKGDRIENLERSIECFYKSLEIYNQNEFLDKWKINQEDLGISQQKLIDFKQLELQKQKAIREDNDQWHLVKDIIDRPVSHRNLKDVELFRASLFDANLISANLSGSNLIIADLRGANLSNANLTGSNLTGANLSDANLSDADLTGASLSGVNLNNTNVKNTKFGSNSGIYLSLKQDLINRGAVFNDTQEDRSESKNLVSR